MNEQRRQIIESLLSYYIGMLNKHKMNVELYLKNPSGVGEHSDIMETITDELKLMSEYEDLICLLKEYF
jgi:hypothetical protein